MRSGAKAGIAAFLFLSLSGCSSAGSLFSYNPSQSDASPRGPARTATVEPDVRPDNGACNFVADERADDAVMAGYVTDGSPARQEIYNVTYRDCVSQHAH